MLSPNAYLKDGVCKFVVSFALAPVLAIAIKIVRYYTKMGTKICKTLEIAKLIVHSTRDVFYVRRKVDLMKTANVNAYIMHIFGKIELLSIHTA